MILIADDDENQLSLLELHLKKAGYGVIKANNGRDAVDLALRNKPELIIMDLMMPRVDGYEASGIIRSNQETSMTPIIFLTALNEEDCEKEIKGPGAYEYIRKPFDVDELLDKIKILVKN